MSFLGEDYLLQTEAAKRLYSQVQDLPILDAHNHGDVKEIVDNEGWEDIWEVEGATDHYVWELMRRCGVEEEKITGEASNREKWTALAEIFPELAGNPTYEWIHLDLKRRFGIDKVISKHTADIIWDKTKAKLATDQMSPQTLLREMNVKIMCTTDNPDSTLEYHKKAQKEISDLDIFPTWRPDKAMNVEKEDWTDFVDSLGEAVDVSISSFSDYLSALENSHDFFDSMGCVASDHGVQEPAVYPVDKKRAQAIFAKALKGKELTVQEVDDFKSYMLLFFAELNEEAGWVTQLHIGAVRDYRDQLYNNLGPDSGGDISTNQLELVENMEYFFNTFDGKMKIVLYYLDPVLEPSAATIARAFPNVYLGAPWWFNDSHYGINKQLEYLSTIDLLSNHAGMVTDSRKLISYDSRTEVFRRTACDVLGRMVEKGQVPFKAASHLAYCLSYKTPHDLFYK